MKAEKPGTNKIASYKYFHSVWSNKKILCYIIINSNESSRFSLCHQFSLEGKYYCVQYLSSLFTRRRSTERSPHKHTMILSSASCTLTPPCLCKAEPCYNKIQGYTVARCCQTPSEFHLKDLVVFCSPADMIKLELQIQNPTAKVHML